MGAFQCDTHHICIADTFKAVICPATGQLNQMGRSPDSFAGLTKSVMPKRVPQLCLSSFKSTPTIWLAPIIRNSCMTFNPAQPEHHCPAPGLCPGGIDDRPNASCHPAADIAILSKGAALFKRNFRQHGKIGKS